MKAVIGFLLGLIWPLIAFAGPEALPEAVKKRILRAPQDYVEQMTRLVAGFGGPAGLTAEGIATHVAVERAYTRADALRGLLAADLDNDGAVTMAEAERLMQVLSARGRGGFLLSFTAADADGDGRADAAELRQAADLVALDRLTPRAAEGLQAVLVFDADGDGAVSLPELRAGVAALAGKS